MMFLGLSNSTTNAAESIDDDPQYCLSLIMIITNEFNGEEAIALARNAYALHCEDLYGPIPF